MMDRPPVFAACEGFTLLPACDGWAGASAAGCVGRGPVGALSAEPLPFLSVATDAEAAAVTVAGTEAAAFSCVVLGLRLAVGKAACQEQMLLINSQVYTIGGEVKRENLRS